MPGMTTVDPVSRSASSRACGQKCPGPRPADIRANRSVSAADSALATANERKAALRGVRPGHRLKRHVGHLSENSTPHPFVSTRDTGSRCKHGCERPKLYCESLSNGSLDRLPAFILRFECPVAVMRALPENSRRSHVVSS
jgi:hypothetical protein